MTRLTWDEAWLQVAVVLSRRSQCSRAQVGAVIVTADNKVDACSYNGPVASLELRGTCESWCPRAQSAETSSDYGRCSAIHAESNALIRSNHERIQGGAIYVSQAMCINCAKEVANSGITRVVQRVTDRDLHRNPREVIKFLRGAKMFVTTVAECTKCELTWLGKPLNLLETHECIGSPSPSLEQFLEYLEVVENERGCLIPTKKLNPSNSGYHQLSKTVARVFNERYAHRVVLQLKLGHAAAYEASHVCGEDYENAKCVNPAHLVEHTHRENHARMPKESRRRASSAGGKASPTKFKSGHATWNKRTR